MQRRIIIKNNQDLTAYDFEWKDRHPQAIRMPPDAICTLQYGRRAEQAGYKKPTAWHELVQILLGGIFIAALVAVGLFVSHYLVALVPYWR